MKEVREGKQVRHQEGKETAESKGEGVDDSSGCACFDGGDLADQDVRHHRAKADAEAGETSAKSKQPEGVTVEHDGEADDAEHIGEEEHFFPAQPLASWESSHDAKHLEDLKEWKNLKYQNCPPQSSKDNISHLVLFGGHSLNT